MADLDSRLYDAVERGNKREVIDLLGKGADPNTGLDTAVMLDQVDIVKLLLQHGADPNEGLDTAVMLDQVDIVKLLLQHGADPNELDQLLLSGYTILLDYLNVLLIARVIGKWWWKAGDRVSGRKSL
ncbi:putative ankyrin repeat protein RF_0950 [Argopecten irradians]|uniref:putative ankyrin repeat protein RF_0950 n=1 Tax=Argopecten irradians TaxID=31199 RepID=UPI003712C62F